MNDHPIKSLLDTSMEKIREMVDVDTIIGDPISVGSDTTIIPVSKVSFGFASGGSDLPTKMQKDLFGGGSGAGISIQPLGFIVVSKGEVKLLQMSANANPTNAVINSIPEVVDKLSAIFSKNKDKQETAEESAIEEK